MYDWITKAREMIARDGAVVLVMVKSAQGSVPRAAGTRMLVGPRSIKGSIGGGALEHMAIARARQMERGAVREMDIPLGPGVGQCCGGRVILHLEYLDSASVMAEDRGDDRQGLYLFGAGHVGKAIISRMDGLPFRIIWADSRADIFPDDIPDNVSVCQTISSLDIVDKAPANSAYLIMTHSHQIDFALTAAILKRRDSAYCGLIGSASKRARFMKRFRTEEGLSDDDCARLTCPVGLAAIAGKEPDIIAIGVIARLLEIF